MGKVILRTQPPVVGLIEGTDPTVDRSTVGREIHRRPDAQGGGPQEVGPSLLIPWRP